MEDFQKLSVWFLNSENSPPQIVAPFRPTPLPVTALFRRNPHTMKRPSQSVRPGGFRASRSCATITSDSPHPPRDPPRGAAPLPAPRQAPAAPRVLPGSVDAPSPGTACTGPRAMWPSASGVPHTTLEVCLHRNSPRANAGSRPLARQTFRAGAFCLVALSSRGPALSSIHQT